jgi:hypothetical protein
MAPDLRKRLVTPSVVGGRFSLACVTSVYQATKDQSLNQTEGTDPNGSWANKLIGNRDATQGVREGVERPELPFRLLRVAVA